MRRHPFMPQPIYAVLFTMVWLLAFCFPAAGQQDQYKFTHIDRAQGLSNSQVKCFLRDSRGFMWIGTSSGLNRYDGYTIENFRNDPRDTASLIDNEITRLFEDPNGRIWISTWSGINVYDPGKETFSRNSNRLLRGYGIPEGVITDLVKDSRNGYWFLHASMGLFRYDANTGKAMRLQNNPADTASISSNQIASFKEDGTGNFWLIHRTGVLEKLDGKTFKVILRNRVPERKYPGEILDYVITVDRDDDVWAFTANNNHGVFYYNSKKKTIQHITRSSSPVHLNTDIVRGVVQDNNGIIWIATDHGGINLINKKDFSVQYVLNDPNDEKSLSQNSINSLYKDREGFIWAGTFKKGLNYYHSQAIRFNLFRHQASRANSLPYDDINCFAEDDKKNLWIGTNGGGLVYYDRARNTYKQFLHDPANANSISSNVIVSIFLDHEQKLWIGTYYGGLTCYDGKKFIRYRHNVADPSSLGDDSIWELFEDSHHTLWIGTLNGGVDIFDRRTNRFSHYRQGDVNSIHASYIPAFVEDREENIWIGTGYGIDVFDRKSGRFNQYLNQPENPKSLSNNSIISLLEDSRGIIWIGTKEGLNFFDPAKKEFGCYLQKDGLPHNTIITLVEDSKANIWMSTPNGLSNLILTRGHDREIYGFHFKNYDESDGLQGKQFNENAAAKTSRGELIFGGSSGFNIFRPEEIGSNDKKPEIILTDFQIFNKSVAIGEQINGNVVLEKSIAETESITLKHSDNVFLIEFAAINFFHPEKSDYKYKLEGFNKDWIAADANNRRVTYTNLDPGDYVFKVKASNNDGVWNDEGRQLKIKILPPFWKTEIAFGIYIIVILGALLLSRQLILERERMKYRIEKERSEATQLHELDMMKLKFFTNVSHEFRTPLTLILTPLEKILKNTNDPDQKNQFQLIYRNARRLLNLVNQLLDFRRMEVQEVKLNQSEGDIIYFIKEVSGSFSDLSEKKSIDFSFSSNVSSLETLFDKEKLEKILFNLLSNAHKFTREHGRVSVEVELQEAGSDEISWLEIRVKDSGIGIPLEKQDKIFERFFQSDLPNSMVNQGSGIGLSITKEFVKAHGGSITVESEVNQGSCFKVRIPLQKISAALHVEPVAEEEELLTNTESVLDQATVHDKKPVLLLVEDNEDFRFYLKDNLKFQYTIIEANNGKDGLRQAQQHVPDLIVSDVMMPEMDGIAFCKRVKNDRNTSHIPVILLTARTAEEQKMEGFETGADDYVTKPFNFEMLQARIKNLIHQRELFHKDFHKHIVVKASDINITSLDEKLIQNAIRLVEDHIADPDFSVENLSRELGMSRVNLYKKLLALTGKPPLEFIRAIRLQRAAQLLEKSQLTVSEVAYKVGFNNPKYFARYFKDEFKILPSAYAASRK